MKFLKRSLTLFALILAYSPATLSAHPPVRCNGMIQFRPCLSTQRVPKRTPPKASLKRVTSRTEVEVLNPTYRKLDRARGEWRGKVRGSGTVHLALLLYTRGNLISERYMGNVALNNKRSESITFQFTSPLPSGKWSWQVKAYA